MAPMDPLAQIETLLGDAVRDHPQAVSAGLLAVAVERKVVSAREAELLARDPGLADVQAIQDELALRLEEQGRTGEVATLLAEGRRALKRAREILDAYGTSP